MPTDSWRPQQSPQKSPSNMARGTSASGRTRPSSLTKTIDGLAGQPVEPWEINLDRNGHDKEDASHSSKFNKILTMTYKYQDVKNDEHGPAPKRGLAGGETSPRRKTQNSGPGRRGRRSEGEVTAPTKDKRRSGRRRSSQIQKETNNPGCQTMSKVPRGKGQ